VQQFVEKYPNPTTVINADVKDMAIELHSLGLNRECTMMKFAAEFLGDWKDVRSLHGCGNFASSSFDMFCRGDFKKVLRDKKADRNVKGYASFVKKLESSGGDGKYDDLPPVKKKRKQTRQRGDLPVRKMTRNRKCRNSDSFA